MESTDNEKVKAPEQEAALDKKGLLRPSVEESKENTNETQKQESARNTRWKPLRVLILLMCMNFLTYVDRGAINACLTEIKVDKIIASTTALTGLKTGSLVSVFMIGYMLTCPVFVHLQDWILPTRLMAIGLTVWIIALIMTTFAMNYSFLIVARALVGIGEAAYAGFTATIIDDMAPRETRTMWLAGFYAMIPVGQASGIAFGGFLSTKVLFGYEGWRTAFGIQAILMVPILFLLLSLPVWCNPREVLELQRLRKKKKASKIIRDVAATNEVVSIRTSGGAAPIAGQSESAERTPLVSRPNGEDDTAVSENSDTPHSYTITESICMLFTNGAYVAIILGYAFYTFTLGAIAVWSVEYLVSGPVRTDVTKASLSFGISTLLTGVIGTVFGGKVIDWMGGSSGFDGAIKCTVFNALNVLLSMPMGFGALLMRHLWSFYMFFTPAEWFMFNPTAPVNAAIISVVPPSLRTHAMSYSVLIIHAIGDFPSAVVAGYLNDVFSFGCQGKNTQDICESFSKDCYWKPATADSQAVCVNEYQLRNSLFVIVSVSLLTSIMWFSAWLLIKREKCKQTIERNQAIQ